MIDRDEMGHIMESVYSMLEAVNARPSDDPKARAEKIFNKIDVNNDGELNREEVSSKISKVVELLIDYY